jgi:rhamnose utilization protein RhaD (predicted bifunctional aldolase and dehydrogenase)
MSDTTLQRALAQLQHISHVLGCNPAFVQAGGGNTSVKCDDGKTMVIKASGTPLSAMDETRGWVQVDLGVIGTLFSRSQLRSLPSAQREAQVLELLGQSIITPAAARPSVETPLHALLDRVVMHGHPVAANALSCSPDGERMLQQMALKGSSVPPLWVPYIDPGATLAFEMADRIELYKQQYGQAPDVMVLQNHGLFVCAPTVGECVQKQQVVLEQIERYFINAAAVAIDESLQAVVVEALGAELGGQQGVDFSVRFCTRTELTQAACSEYYKVFEGALTPDHVVYTGPSALIVEPSLGVGQLREQLGGYKQRWGIYPRMILIRGRGMVLVTDSAKKLDAAEALAVSAVQIAQLNQNTIRFLQPKDVDFIMNWEAEHYRAKQS